MRYLTVLALMLIAALPTVDASGCRVVAVRRANVVHHVEAVKIVQAVVPYYYGYYVPAAQPSGENTEALKTLADQLRQINDRLQRLEGGSPTPMKPADPKPVDPFNPDPPQALKASPAASCIACHDQGIAASKGGGFVFSKGGKVREDFTGEEAAEIIRQVTLGKMPKRPHNMSAEERLAFVGVLVGK